MINSKSENTRQQLIDTGIYLLTDNLISNTSILDIATRAGVSNGTFYNYFSSKDELIEAAALHVAENFTMKLRDRLRGVEDSAERIAIVTKMFVTQSLTDPALCWALLRGVGSLPRISELVRMCVLSQIREGRTQKHLTVNSEAAAVDLVLGTLLAGIRSVLEGREHFEHLAATTELSLIGLGVNPEKAIVVVKKIFT